MQSIGSPILFLMLIAFKLFRKDLKLGRLFTNVNIYLASHKYELVNFKFTIRLL